MEVSCLPIFTCTMWLSNTCSCTSSPPHELASRQVRECSKVTHQNILRVSQDVFNFGLLRNKWCHLKCSYLICYLIGNLCLSQEYFTYIWLLVGRNLGNKAKSLKILSRTNSGLSNCFVINILHDHVDRTQCKVLQSHNCICNIIVNGLDKDLGSRYCPKRDNFHACCQVHRWTCVFP